MSLDKGTLSNPFDNQDISHQHSDQNQEESQILEKVYCISDKGFVWKETTCMLGKVR